MRDLCSGFLIMSVVGFALWGQVRPAAASGSGEAQDLSMITQLYADYRQAVETGSIAGYLEVLHPQVRMLPPGADPIDGAQRYASFLQPVFATASYRIEVKELPHITVLGEVAIAEYEYVVHLTLKDPKVGVSEPGALSAQATRSRYFDVLRKKTDGRWAIWRHTWSELKSTQVTADDSPPISGVSLRKVRTNGISMRIAEAGEGPMVLFAHGFPESWFSWRHQLQALAAAGYRAVAVDMRGYGMTDAPAEPEAYVMDTLAADMVGVLDALGVEQAHMVGHDWGSPVASHTVVRYPQRFKSLTLMSVPYQPRSPVSPLQAMRERTGDNFFYMVYHNEPGGVAEAEYDADVRTFLRRIYQSPGAERHPPEVTNPARSAGGWIPRMGEPLKLPEWLRPQDLDYYVQQFERSGFRGGVNYYRTFEQNWRASADLEQPVIRVPVLFVAGAADSVIGGANAQQLAASMAPVVADLRRVLLLPDVGHWVQQEAAEETNQAILSFLQQVEAP